ncbi:MAG: hypothetical protein WCC57_05565 [Paracoccaceae bacterium]
MHFIALIAPDIPCKTYPTALRPLWLQGTALALVLTPLAGLGKARSLTSPPANCK